MREVADYLIGGDRAQQYTIPQRRQTAISLQYGGKAIRADGGKWTRD